VRGMFRRINLRSAWLAILGFGVLEFGVLGFVPASHAVGHAASFSDRGQGSNASPAAVRPAVVVNKHSVKLSWAASVPASKSARDAVVGYNVYRSTKSHDRNAKRINSAVCVGTSYTDPDAEAGNTYFYVTRGVNTKGVESGPSNEVKVVMPPR
jgi:fibronectin type 3 domain-containing protein